MQCLVVPHSTYPQCITRVEVASAPRWRLKTPSDHQLPPALMPLSSIFGAVFVVFLESNPRRLEQMALAVVVCDYECVKFGVAARLICCDLCLSETMKDSSRLRLADKPALCSSVLSRASPSWRSCVSSCTRPPTPPSDTRLRKLWWSSPTAPTVSANVSCCWREAV